MFEQTDLMLNTESVSSNSSYKSGGFRFYGENNLIVFIYCFFRTKN
jgi:hypothetical protein